MNWIGKIWVGVSLVLATAWGFIPETSGKAAPVIDAQLRCTTTDLTIGESVLWSLALQPINLASGDFITNLTFESLDPKSWYIENLPPISVLAYSQIIQITATPLRAGLSRPALIVHYELGISPQAISVLGEPIEIHELSDQINGEVRVKNHPEGFSSNAVVEIEMTNRAPFRMEDIQIEFVDTHIKILQTVPKFQVNSGQTAFQSVVIDLGSWQPIVPQVRLSYTWTDNLGVLKNGEQTFSGEAVVPRPWISPALLSALAGFLGGVGTMVVKSWFEQHQLRNAARTRVYSLLHRTLTAGKHASHFASEFPTNMLEPLWQDGLLFVTLNNSKLLQAVLDVLNEGNIYNLTIRNQRGLQNADLFQQKLKILEDMLNAKQSPGLFWYKWASAVGKYWHQIRHKPR